MCSPHLMPYRKVRNINNRNDGLFGILNQTIPTPFFTMIYGREACVSGERTDIKIRPKGVTILFF